MPAESEYQSAKSRWLLFRLHVAHYIKNPFYFTRNKNPLCTPICTFIQTETKQNKQILTKILMLSLQVFCVTKWLINRRKFRILYNNKYLLHSMDIV
ncbi:hypothetical protein PB01_04030 [Psychrobacillus glaciei]|uniref:Uncharacterized protein n=1 Tax=Psychrobacillus glaciei TaxID=2283160 RepID=A0A5J6SJI5_9BACI|nr:hypothetical protein PB01_04030 [Psychrobacillus glaciei]